MKNINIEKINLFYDFIDQACMTLYEEIGLGYLDALIRVGNDLVFEIDESRLNDETIEKLDEIYDNLRQQSFYNEEIRLAWELLLVKGFKHKNLPLNVMTPDTINYLISVILKDKFEEKKVTIMDTLLGTSNLLQAIANNMDQDVELIGIEKEEHLVKLSEIASNLQNNEMKIYYQDALKEVYDKVDVVVGDLESYEYSGEINSILYEKGIRYFPYLVIEKRLDNIIDDGYFVYVIDNDFFSKEDNGIFKSYLQENATLVALIVLPQSIVQEGHVGKSILIGKKKVLQNYHMAILNILNFEKDYLEDVFNKLEQIVKDI